MEILKDLSSLERAEEVSVALNPNEVYEIIDKLKETLDENPNLTSISAPQLGIDKRIICMNFNGEYKTFINPLISKSEGLHLSRETQPHLNGKEYVIPRNDRVMVIYQKITGMPETNKFEGVASEVIQSQVNLLDGVTIDRYGLEIIPEFDTATDEEKEEVIKAYIESLKYATNTLNQEIENDDELKRIRDGIEFMKGVQLGEITIEREEKKVPKIDPRKKGRRK